MEGEAMTICRELLERMRTPGASTADKMRLFRDIDTFLAQGCDAEKALEGFRLGESDHFFGCGVFHKLDKECSLACVAACAALSSPAQGGVDG